MSEYPYTDPDEVIRNADSPALLVILDRIQDPFNVGAIIRSAEVLGVDGIFLPEKGQCGVNSMVARTSAGAVNRISIARIADVIQFAEYVKGKGIRLACASEKNGIEPSKYDFNKSTTLVFGNEGEGISEGLLDMCDANIRIPQKGDIGSLNVAAAAAVILYESVRQRRAE
jgi:23S rRNA (guanosine2251-2'-O)-methyltransferase